MRRLQWSLDGTRFYIGNALDGVRNNVSATVQTKLDAEPWSASNVNPNDWAPNDSDFRFVIWNFPHPVTIEKVAHWSSTSMYRDIQVSSDTGESALPGVTGNWQSIGNYTNTASTYSESPILTPISTQWLRWYKTSHWHQYHAAMHLYGSYDLPLVTLYNDDQPVASEITSSTYFDFGAARSNSDFNETKVFRIRNNDLVPHTYSATIDAQNYSDVLFVDDHFTLSVDGGNTKLSALSTDPVLPGENSIPITLHADIPIAENPGNGWYYPRVIVNTET